MKKYALGVGGLAAVIVGLFVVVGSSHVFAVGETSVKNGQNTLRISPVRTDAIIKKGETGIVSIKVSNLSKTPMTVRPYENDFVAGSNEDGQPALILDVDKYAPSHSLKRFMKPLQDVTVPAEGSVDVKLSISVPADAQAGGYFGAVRLQPVTTEGTSNVGIDSSVASLVLLTVPGALVEKLNLTNFNVYQGDKTDAWFQSANDLSVKFRLENVGNVQAAPHGAITVKQGNDVIYTSDFNNDTPRQVVLPDSARKWEVPLKGLGSFGRYTVEAVLTYGEKNESINITKTFWIIPMSVIIIAVGGTLGLIALIVGIWLFLRRYKRKVLSSSGGRRGYRR